mgnify:CR=1 FL=1
MPRQIYKIDQFHGGLNTQANPSDLQDNEQVSLTDAMVDELGKVKLMGGVASSVINTADNTGITGTMKAGYGIHAWKSDYKGAEDKGSEEAATGDDYVAMYDGNDGQVWVYSAATDDFDDDVNLSAGNGIMDIGSSTTASVLPTFYSMEGGLRLSDGNHALSNSSKWYGYIKRTLFQSITSTVVTDGWFDYDQYISAPADTSQWDGTISAYGVSAGSNYDPTVTAAATIFLTANDLFDNSVINFNSAIEVTVTITTGTITGIPDETDFDAEFNLTVGSGGSSSSSDFNGTAGTSHQVTSQSEMGNAVSSGTKDIVYTFNLGNNYHNGSANAQSFADSDTANGVRATLVSTSTGKLLSSVLISNVKVVEGTITTTNHASLTAAGLPNVFLEVNMAAAPASPIVASGWDTIWQHGVSFIYDGNQESLIRTLYDGTDTEANRQQSVTNSTYAPITKFYVEHGTNTSHNRRITGAVWYVRDAGGDTFSPWCAQIEYDYVKGVARVLATGKEFDVEYNVSDEEYMFSVDHDYLATPNLVDTYLSRTGILDTEAAVKANYSTATVAGRRVYIGNVKILNEDGSTEIKGDAMIKSPPNKFDIFPSSSVVEASISDGESIVKLETFADRILQYKQDTLYIINVAQDVEFLEDVHKYKGVKHPSMVCKTDYGIAWVNELGCYLYDGRQVTNLLEKGGQKIIDDTTWQDHVIDASGESSMIGYVPKKRQLIVVKDNGDNANAGNIFLYDMVTRSWTFGDSKMTDSQIKSNFIVFQNELIYMHTNATNDFVKWDSSPDSSSNFSFKTKDINFGMPGVRKKVYAVYITYKANADTEVQATYRTNGATTSYNFAVKNSIFDEGGSSLDDFGDAEDSTVELSSTSNVTKVATMKPATSSQANNINSFQLILAPDSGQSAHDTFEIDNIEIVYRTKGIR